MNIVVNEILSKVIVVNKGIAGVGVPSGGDSGKILAKASSSDYDTVWISASSGDMLSANNLSDVSDISIARQNLSAITNAESIINSLIFG